MDVGPVELLIVLAVVLLLFGSKKLPELAKGMGQAAKEFRSGLHEEDAERPAPEATPAPAVAAAEPPASEAPGPAPKA
jgi:sec-independent protein translocase protein TatA